MEQIKQAGEFFPELARDVAELRRAAADAQSQMRTLKEIEMGWVAGGDGAPIWPY